MYLGYNTNGFAHHRLADALLILHDLGYQGVALTPDVHHLDPFAPDWLPQVERFGQLLHKLNLKCVVESGAWFVLDPWQKHQPTLLSGTPELRQRRRHFLKQLAEAAELLGSTILSLWSGSPLEPTPPDLLMQRLTQEIKLLLDEMPQTVQIAFEPEPGMFIANMVQFEELHDQVNDPRFGLTLDVGHVVCERELPFGAHLQKWRHKLWNIHLEDMRAGVHDHLLFGEGEVPFAELFAGLREIDYTGGLAVELSRHSHDAVRTAAKSAAFVRSFLGQ